MTAALRRLNRTPGKGHIVPLPRSLRRECKMCGAAFQTPARTPGLFCSPEHKREYNNRRQKRGAPLWDLFMANRYDRAAAAAIRAEFGVSLWTLMCRMAQQHREEDAEHRGGRPSWRNPRDVLADNPHLFSVSTDTRRKVRP